MHIPLQFVIVRYFTLSLLFLRNSAGQKNPLCLVSALYALYVIHYTLLGTGSVFVLVISTLV